MHNIVLTGRAAGRDIFFRITAQDRNIILLTQFNSCVINIHFVTVYDAIISLLWFTIISIYSVKAYKGLISRHWQLTPRRVNGYTENSKWIIWLIWAIVCHFTDKKRLIFTHFWVILSVYWPTMAQMSQMIHSGFSVIDIRLFNTLIKGSNPIQNQF